MQKFCASKLFSLARFARAFVAFVVACVPMFSAFAAKGRPQGEPITSSIHGGTPYQVVSLKAATAANPAGIYRRNSGNWKIIVPGDTALDELGEPWVFQLEISRVDSRRAAIALVDGKLNLFTIKSDPSQPNSLITLGSRQAPLVEIGTSQTRFLPKIERIRDVSVYQDPQLDPSSAQLVLISLHLGEQAVTGTGLTFAFLLKPSRDETSIEFVGRPVVLDYEFHDQQVLPNLVSPNAGSREKILYSKILVETLEVERARNATGGIAEHFEAISNWLTDFIRQNSFTDSDLRKFKPAAVAYNISLQVINRNVEFSRAWTVNSHGGSATIVQEYSPVDHRGVVKLSLRRGDPVSVDGFVGLTKNKTAPLAWVTSDQQVFAVINDELYFYDQELLQDAFKLGAFSAEVFRSDLTNAFFGANGQPPSIDNMTFLVQPSSVVDPKTGGKDYFVFFSGDFVTVDGKKRGVTQYYRLHRYQNGHVTSTGPFPLLSFAVDEGELSRRITESSDPAASVLFDTITVEVGSIEAYELAANPTEPRLNLLSEAQREFRYIRASNTIKFEDGLVFAQFIPTQGVPDPTGLYSVNDEVSGNETTRVVGQLLRPSYLPEITGEATVQSYALAKISLLRNGEFENGKKRRKTKANQPNTDSFYVFALDPSRRGGNGGYTLVLATNAVDSDGSPFKLQALAVNKGGLSRFSDVTNFRIFRGKGKNSRKLLLFFSVVNSSDSLAVTNALLIDLDTLDTVGNFATSYRKPIGDHALEDGELKGRIRYSEDGMPYLVLTPEIPTGAHLYEVYDFISGRSIRPNQLKGPEQIVFSQELDGFDEDRFDLVQSVPERLSWRLYSHDVAKKYPNVGRSAELGQFDSFRELRILLDQMADISLPPQKTIMIVPPALRDLVWDFILSRYLEREETAKVRGKAFNRENFDLMLSVFDAEKSSQDAYFANIEGMRTQLKKTGPVRGKPFLLANAEDILKNATPNVSETGSVPFNISVVGATSSGENEINTSRESRLPHAMYLLAAGMPVELSAFRNEPMVPYGSVFILATPEEMKEIDNEAAAEVDNGLLKQFTIKEIRDPDRESMSSALMTIFDNPDVQSLSYRFSATEIKPRAVLSDREKFEVVLDYAVSRFENLIQQKKQSIFESFMRFRTAFASAVVSDRQARQSGVIDKLFVERVLTQVFDIPMNLNTLPPDDPMRILSRPDAPLKLQEAGYSGPFDLKQKIIRTILSQTLADAGKPIPSSIILFGDTGAGKTYLFTTLLKMLNIKLYKFDGSDNRDAGGIILDLSRITESGDGGDGSLSVKLALEHLNTFLAGPNGYRGWILIDDAHAASDKVKAEILTAVRGLFQSPGGMYTATQKVNGRAGVTVKRPVRNLNIFMTLNPTADQSQIEKYSKDKAKPTIEEILLATLSTDSFKIEPSFLRRWGSIVNLNTMPAGAKGPELIRALGEASKNLNSSQSRVALVEPAVIRTMVENNSGLDARSFLSASTSALLQLVGESQEQGSVSMVVMAAPNRQAGQTNALNENPGETIARWVRQKTRVLSLDGSVDGNLAMMKLVVDAYRVPLYEFLVTALLEDTRFSATEFQQKNLLGPALAAVEDHLRSRGTVPLSALELSPTDFGLASRGERESFKETVRRNSEFEKPFFPIRFTAAGLSMNTWQELLDSRQEALGGRSRHDVLAETTNTIDRLLQEHLNRVMRTPNVNSPGEPIDWLNRLRPGEDPEIKKVGRELAQVLWQYIPQMFDQQLIEYQSARPDLSTYAAVRLFLYALDRGVVNRPWVRVNRFLLNALQLVTEDQVLSQQSGVQDFLFSSRFRLIKPTLPDVVFMMLSNSPALSEMPARFRKQLDNSFESDCEKLLEPAGP